jgi:hypothetical protein
MTLAIEALAILTTAVVAAGCTVRAAWKRADDADLAELDDWLLSIDATMSE